MALCSVARCCATSGTRRARFGRQHVLQGPLQDFDCLGHFGGHDLIDHPTLVFFRHQRLDAMPQITHKSEVWTLRAVAKVGVMLDQFIEQVNELVVMAGLARLASRQR